MADKTAQETAEGILETVKNVAVAAADAVENFAESVTGIDLDKDGEVGTEGSEKLVAGIKKGAETAAGVAVDLAGKAKDKIEDIIEDVTKDDDDDDDEAEGAED